MTGCHKTLGGALAFACIVAVTFGETGAWSQAASSQPNTSLNRRTIMAIAETTMKRETMSRDLANHSPDIHWPEGFSPGQAEGPFSFNSAAENGPFFFWFLWVKRPP
jgi:hypothetical protein